MLKRLINFYWNGLNFYNIGNVKFGAIIIMQWFALILRMKIEVMIPFKMRICFYASIWKESQHPLFMVMWAGSL